MDTVLMVRLSRGERLRVEVFARREIPSARSEGWRVCCDPRWLTASERSEQIQEIREAEVDRWPFKSWKRKR